MVATLLQTCCKLLCRFSLPSTFQCRLTIWSFKVTMLLFYNLLFLCAWRCEPSTTKCHQPLNWLFHHRKKSYWFSLTWAIYVCGSETMESRSRRGTLFTSFSLGRHAILQSARTVRCASTFNREPSAWDLIHKLRYGGFSLYIVYNSTFILVNLAWFEPMTASYHVVGSVFSKA